LLRARLIEWTVSGGHSFKPDKPAIGTKDRQQRPAGHLPLEEIVRPRFRFFVDMLWRSGRLDSIDDREEPCSLGRIAHLQSAVLEVA
jgi:hypothetical protein